MSLTQDIRDAFNRRDNALNQLIILNALVFAVLIILRAIFFITQSQGYVLVMRQLALPSDAYSLLRHPWTLLSYAFVHEGFLHILFNMLNLYWFGQLIREYLGDRRLVGLYILGALVGGVFFLLAYNFIPALQPFVGRVPVIGASASVTAIIVAAATLLPDYTFMLFIIGAVKIKWIAVAVVLISIAGINGGNPGGEITHLGGALLGFVFVRQLKAGRDMSTPVTAVLEWFSRVFSQKPSSMRVTHRQPAAATARATGSSSKPTGPSVAGQDEIDLILDKISHSGYESLSKDEKQKLFRASQQ